MSDEPDWSQLRAIVGRATKVPSHLEALGSPSKAKRARALDELALMLQEDGDRSEAAVACIPLLCAALETYEAETRQGVLELLSWLSVADPGEALRQNLVPVGPGDPEASPAWHRAGELNTRAYLAVEDAAPRIAAQLGSDRPAVRGAALGVLANAPPCDATSLLGATGDDLAPLRGLAWVAVAKQARYWKQPLDEARLQAALRKAKGTEATLIAGAWVLYSPARPAWEALFGVLKKNKKLSFPRKDLGVLPQALRAEGLLGWALHLLVASEATDTERTLSMLASAPRSLSSETLEVLAAALFRDDVRGATPEMLHETQRGFLSLLAETDELDVSVNRRLLSLGLPIPPVDTFLVLYPRAVRNYLGLDAPDVYRVPLSLRLGESSETAPAYVWIHRALSGALDLDAWAEALAGAYALDDLIALGCMLTRPAEDLVGPGYNRVPLHRALLAAVQRLPNAGDAFKVRWDAGNFSGGAHAWVASGCVANGVELSDATVLGRAIHIERLPGTDELANELLDALGVPMASQVVASLEFDGVESLDRRQLLEPWDLVSRHPAPEAAAKAAVGSLMKATRPPFTQGAVSRVFACLTALQPHARPLVERAVRAKKRGHWTPLLQTWLSGEA